VVFFGNVFSSVFFLKVSLEMDRDLKLDFMWEKGFANDGRNECDDVHRKFIFHFVGSHILFCFIFSFGLPNVTSQFHAILLASH